MEPSKLHNRQYKVEKVLKKLIVLDLDKVKNPLKVLVIGEFDQYNLLFILIIMDIYTIERVNIYK